MGGIRLQQQKIFYFIFILGLLFKLGNHDCARVASRIGKENVKLANALCLLLGGTPITYYGEEIGMENLDYDSISFENCQDHFSKSFGVYLKYLKKAFFFHPRITTINY